LATPPWPNVAVVTYQYYPSSTSLSLTCIDVFGIVLCNGYRAIPHLKPAWLRVIRALPPAWLIAPATGELFEGKEDCHQRLQGWGLFEGFGFVQGRIWKDGTPRWEFKCKLHGTKTLNTRGVEPRKRKDKESKMVTDQQRNTMVKTKTAVLTRCCLTKLSVKVAIGKMSYIESQRMLEQERLGMIIIQKTFYNLLRRQPSDSSKPSLIDGLLAALHESDFVYRKRTEVEKTPGKLTPARIPPALQSAPEPFHAV
jgi:hypothetical protein